MRSTSAACSGHSGGSVVGAVAASEKGRGGTVCAAGGSWDSLSWLELTRLTVSICLSRVSNAFMACLPLRRACGGITGFGSSSSELDRLMTSMGLRFLPVMGTVPLLFCKDTCGDSSTVYWPQLRFLEDDSLRTSERPDLFSSLWTVCKGSGLDSCGAGGEACILGSFAALARFSAVPALCVAVRSDLSAASSPRPVLSALTGFLIVVTSCLHAL